MILRRSFLGLMTAVLVGAAGAGPAFALNDDEAKGFVQSTVDEVLALVSSPGDATGKAGPFRRILEDRAAMPQIARAAAGPAWRQMSDDQRGRYSNAFADYLARVYARRFGEYGGERVEIGRSRDQGKRGVMVSSRVVGSGEPVAVDWLVTDRPGRVVIADIVIENVSLVITQRDEIAGLFERNGRDPEKLISALEGI